MIIFSCSEDYEGNLIVVGNCGHIYMRISLNVTVPALRGSIPSRKRPYGLDYVHKIISGIHLALMLFGFHFIHK